MPTFGKNNLIVPNPTPTGQKNTAENTSRLEHIDKQTMPLTSGIHSRSATVEDLLDHIHLALDGCQSYWLPLSTMNPWLVYFPYAWYLNADSRIINKTTGAEYSIDNYEPKIGENVVKLKADSSVAPPAENDILTFDNTNGKNLRFQHAYPNSDDVNRYVTPEEIEKNMTSGFIDTISFKVKIAPAEIKGVAQYGPRKMQEVVDPIDGNAKVVFMEHFDNLVSFQCWTKTMERTTKLARWFRTFMRMYHSTFQLNGTQQLLFVRQSEEYNVTRWRNDIVGSTLVYNVRTQEIFETSETILKHFQVSLGLPGRLKEKIDISMNTEK
jgi:hypothetical protein